MSGWRRTLMMQAAQRQYIEGYAVQVDGAYPATIQARINNTLTTINVDQSTGYWRWIGTITSLNSFMLDSNNCSSVKIHYRDSTPISMYQLIRRCQTITHLDCSGVEVSNLYFAFGLNSTDYNNGYRSALQSIKLPIIRNTTSSSNDCFAQTRQLTDVEASYIESSLSFSFSQLTLQSAINILNALQDVTSYGGKTLTFSSTTKGYINNDPDALALVANAVNNLGWTIALN